MQHSPEIVVCTLGAFRLERADRAAPHFKYLDARELLVHLLLFTTRGTAGNLRGRSKQEIGAALWGDISDTQLNARFKARLNDVRRVLGAREWIVFEQEEYKFDLARGVVFDVRDFLEHCENAASAQRANHFDAERDELQKAIGLYRGDFLQGYHTRRKKEFSGEREWYLTFREELQQKYRAALERLAQIEMDARQFDAAVDLLRKLVALDEYADDAHAQLMLALSQQGKRGHALRHYQSLVKTRADVLPDSELTALFEKINRNEDLGTLQRGTINLAMTPKTSGNNNLPHQPTKFIGRVREREELGTLSKRTQLLTLTGAGGSGKTRLALQVGAELLDEFEKGAWFVELAPISDPALVPNAVLNALELRDEGGRAPLDILTDFLRAKKLLLILDNCEHLIDACARLAQHLLTHCTQLQILATSREALGIPGEIIYPVPTLALPDPSLWLRTSPKHLPSLETLSQYDAVKLFIERATAVQPNFAVTNANAPAVAQICYRLDGIPLAIELAAARIKMFSPEQLAARLDERLRVLTGGSRTATPRQQTLRGAIEWSYGLLSEQERILFRRLAVFTGGWAFEAAENVCAGDEIDAFAILELLAQLLNKSLVTTEPRGNETRYRMLETIREYAFEKLKEAGETDALRDKHLYYFVSFAEQAEPELKRAEQFEWLERLDAEQDNFRAAFEWSHGEGRVEKGLRLAVALCHYWEMRGNWVQALAYIENLLRQPEAAAKSLLRGKALFGAAFMRNSVENVKLPDAYFEEAIEIARAHGIQGLSLLARALGAYSESFTANRNLAVAEAMQNEGLALAGSIGDEWLIGYILYTCGWIPHIRKDYSGARKMYRESQTLFQACGDAYWVEKLSYSISMTHLDERNLVQARQETESNLPSIREQRDRNKLYRRLTLLGEIARGENNYALAKVYYAEADLIGRELGSRNMATTSDYNLGIVAIHDGELETASALFAESLEIALEINNTAHIGGTLMGMASLAAAKQRGQQAVMLFAFGEHFLGAEDKGTWVDVAEYDHYLALARNQLSEQEFDAAWEYGRALTLEQAIELARSI